MKWFLYLSFVLLISGCGGGSSSESPATTSNTTNKVTVEISGKVIDGYIKNATVFLDTNANNILDNNESSSETNSSGDYKFSALIEKDSEPSIIAFGGIDIDTDKEFKAILKSKLLFKDINGSNHLTPVLTLLSSFRDNNITLDEAKVYLSRFLDIDEEYLMKDFIPLYGTHPDIYEKNRQLVILYELLDINESLNGEFFDALREKAEESINYKDLNSILLQDTIVNIVDEINSSIVQAAEDTPQLPIEEVLDTNSSYSPLPVDYYNLGINYFEPELISASQSIIDSAEVSSEGVRALEEKVNQHALAAIQSIIAINSLYFLDPEYTEDSLVLQRASSAKKAVEYLREKNDENIAYLEALEMQRAQRLYPSKAPYSRVSLSDTWNSVVKNALEVNPLYQSYKKIDAAMGYVINETAELLEYYEGYESVAEKLAYLEGKATDIRDASFVSVQVMGMYLSAGTINGATAAYKSYQALGKAEAILTVASEGVSVVNTVVKLTEKGMEIYFGEGNEHSKKLTNSTARKYLSTLDGVLGWVGFTKTLTKGMVGETDVQSSVYFIDGKVSGEYVSQKLKFAKDTLVVDTNEDVLEDTIADEKTVSKESTLQRGKYIDRSDATTEYSQGIEAKVSNELKENIPLEEQIEEEDPREITEFEDEAESIISCPGVIEMQGSSKYCRIGYDAEYDRYNHNLLLEDTYEETLSSGDLQTTYRVFELIRGVRDSMVIYRTVPLSRIVYVNAQKTHESNYAQGALYKSSAWTDSGTSHAKYQVMGLEKSVLVSSEYTADDGSYDSKIKYKALETSNGFSYHQFYKEVDTYDSGEGVRVKKITQSDAEVVNDTVYEYDTLYKEYRNNKLVEHKEYQRLVSSASGIVSSSLVYSYYLSNAGYDANNQVIDGENITHYYPCELPYQVQCLKTAIYLTNSTLRTLSEYKREANDQAYIIYKKEYDVTGSLTRFTTFNTIRHSDGVYRNQMSKRLERFGDYNTDRFKIEELKEYETKDIQFYAGHPSSVANVVVRHKGKSWDNYAAGTTTSYDNRYDYTYDSDSHQWIRE